MAVRDRDERIRFVWAVLADGHLDEARDRVREHHGRRDEHERPHAPAHECEHEREDDPDEAVRAELRQPDEDVVERLPPVVDDPPLGVFIPRGQTGAICFVWSISCWRSNGLPTNACAPAELACCCARSSALPLNMTTGIAPAP